MKNFWSVSIITLLTIIIVIIIGGLGANRAEPCSFSPLEGRSVAVQLVREPDRVDNKSIKMILCFDSGLTFPLKYLTVLV